ncbi:hypothetical protein CH063_04912 [Colletotrichum higginsianum]|uniref:Uncharacterized protein n=1 Tax=Colletotrichum higginsianum (strain IMI 349063) TaxID=759273 RepID=H1UX35_COLHI|nr:hypothetical protein CH063_04912 [Colletotrichum higginsianum]
MRFIKTESWGDIPAHHKKVSERHRETGVASRVFADMSEITDSVGERRGFGAYLCDATDVLVAVLFGETEVLVEPEPNVVAIQTVGGNSQVQQMLFKGGGNGRLARGRESGQPHSEAALAAKLVALMAREGGVPCDVAIGLK